MRGMWHGNCWSGANSEARWEDARAELKVIGVNWYLLVVSVVALVAAVVLWKRLDDAEERGYHLGVVSSGTYVSSHERASARHWTRWYLAGVIVAIGALVVSLAFVARG